MTSTAIAALEPRRTFAGRHIRGEMREQPDVLARLARHVAYLAQQVSALPARDGSFRAVDFLAHGCTEHVALLGKQAVEERSGLVATVVTAPPDRSDASARDFSGHLVIVLSCSGYESDLLALARRYQDGGAAVVSVTNDGRSPLAQLGVLSVDVAAGLELAATPTKSVTGLMLAVLALVAGLPAASAREASAAAESMVCDVADPASASGLARLVAELLAAEPGPLAAAAARIAAARRVAVVGGGRLHPAALETARMLREAAGLRVEAYSAEEFDAGSGGRVDPDTAVVLLAGDSPENVLALRARLREEGVALVALGYERFEPDVPIPALDSAAECILGTVRGQQLAVAAACARGVDPDRPKVARVFEEPPKSPCSPRIFE